MSKNYLFTKKGKRQFNKLSDKDKRTVAEMAMTDAVNKVMREKITESMITGMRLRMESLYQKHVQSIDQMATGDKEWILAVEQLLSEIRIGHLEYEKMSGENEENEA